jgi:thiamine biosynthesis lipoprotein
MNIPCKSQLSFHSLGTTNSLLAYGDNAEEALQKAKKRVEEIDDEMSAFKATSFISRLNKNAGIEPLQVPADVFALLQCSKKIAALSEGAFNILIRPLSALWDFGNKIDFIPPKEEIASLLQKGLLDPSGLVLYEAKRTAFLAKKGMAVDLGGIAKGYAADEVKKIFLEEGIQDGLINLGGNVLGLGSFQGALPWRIGIRNPLSLTGDYFTILSIHEEAVVTSGVDEQFFIRDGIRYHHILDPRTGYPARSSLASVTIVGKESTLADGLATACFVLGKEKGTTLALSLGYQAIFVSERGEVYASFPLELVGKK